MIHNKIQVIVIMEVSNEELMHEPSSLGKKLRLRKEHIVKASQAMVAQQ